MARIALTYIKYPMAIGTYFEDAFRNTEHEIITVCPYSGTWIPWKGGMHLPEKYAIPPDYQIPWDQRAWYSFEQAEELMGFRKIDVWVSIDAAYHLRGKPRDALSVWIAVDSHCVNYDEQREQADFMFNVHQDFMRPGDIHLPVGYSPRWHYPVFAEEEYDVMLLGLMYPNRVAAIQQMAWRGHETLIDNGPCFDEARELYAKTKLIFNWSLPDNTVCRVWESMAMGKCLVTNYSTTLRDGFEDEIHYVGFSNMAECIEKMEYLLAHDNTRKAIAQAGYKAVQSHTYDQRVRTILETIGL